ncbi:hypothetical protein [Halosolutus halophilus]|uniref:hypothetical protein n=1 Tax=Halosolutus halophilus TaxID=1552990 RepID=UPI00223506E3|nr:hypothetical protein [Halosolutus halophilus]
MSSRRAVALLVLATVVGLTIAPIGSGAVASAITEDESSDETETNTTVSTFVQASTADAENSIEEGMVEARYETADNETKAEIVAERTDELEDSLEDLETEREALRDQRDEMSHGQYQARLARLTVEIIGLEQAIEKNGPRAAETGVDEERLRTLKNNASELAGKEVAEMARGMVGPDRVPGQGPPDDRETGASKEDQGNGQAPGQTDDTGQIGSDGGDEGTDGGETGNENGDRGSPADSDDVGSD